MSYRFLSLLLLVAFAPGASASDPFIGEWAMDRELCDHARLFWNAEGSHGALSFDDGRWGELASGKYVRDGDVLTHTLVPLVMGGSGPAEPVTERVRITMRGPDRLTLENLEREVPDTDSAVDLVRCPPR